MLEASIDAMNSNSYKYLVKQDSNRLNNTCSFKWLCDALGLRKLCLTHLVNKAYGCASRTEFTHMPHKTAQIVSHPVVNGKTEFDELVDECRYQSNKSFCLTRRPFRSTSIFEDSKYILMKGYVLI